jgi:AmmeMemoRadiSam system protein B/AmmeMemoRadiSam system protein A
LPAGGDNKNYAGVKIMVRIGLILTIVITGGAIMTFFANHTDGQKEKVREAGVAGAFYPADPAALTAMIDDLLSQAEPPPIGGRIIGLISPHAGYVYSGHVAASGYELLNGRSIGRVIVISPSHLIAFKGVAVYDGQAYQTPLGTIPVDEEFARKLAAVSPSIVLSAEGHETQRQGRTEHALEVQLPFLQRVLGKFKLVPVIMGDQEYEVCRALGIALAETIRDEGTIIVASSDLSHFHSYNEAVKMDAKVVNAVEDWDHLNLSRNLNRRVWEACGGGPIVAMMIAAERLGANQVKIVRYANSGDVAIGDKSSVVGYMSAVFYRDEATAGKDDFDFSLNKEEQAYLLKIARETVGQAVREGKVYNCSSGGFESLKKDRGAFVTLQQDGNLRGCIGYTAAVQPLYETVRDAALNAATKDPRFPAVSKEELSKLNYEISVLSPFRQIADTDQIQVGKHGLLIQKGKSAGLLLPQVATDYQWDRRTFLEHTCRKAGLPPDAWKDEATDIFIFSAFVFGEE